jgi:hypothetical protein
MSHRRYFHRMRSIDAEPLAPVLRHASRSPDAHHLQPLYLGREDDFYNLGAVEVSNHRRGHPRLDDQTSMMGASEWMLCKPCSGFLRKHPVGQEYKIVGSK